MQTCRLPHIDRFLWDHGLWDNEPDVGVWQHAGFPCVINRNSKLGFLCAYVGVSKSHVLFSLDHFEDCIFSNVCVECSNYGSGLTGHSVDNVVSVHGGLSFSGRMDDVSSLSIIRDSCEGFWMYGFDCGHSCDSYPVRDYSYSEDGSYRTFFYVRENCNRLAETLSQFRFIRF